VTVLFILVAFYIVLYLGWYLLVRRAPWSQLGWQQAWWLLPYFTGMWVISYLGPAAAMGGHDVIGFFTGMWILAGFSLVILALALTAGQNSEAAQRCSDRVQTLGSRGIESLFNAGEPPAP